MRAHTGLSDSGTFKSGIGRSNPAPTANLQIASVVDRELGLLMQLLAFSFCTWFGLACVFY
jgi:hypothetical protein